MDDFGDKLNAILENPGQLEKITQMAKSIMGGETKHDGYQEPKSDPGFIDPSMLKKLSGFMGGGARDDKRALLEAMKPYLSEKRRKKIEKALRMAKLASFAGLALSEFGQDDD